MTDGSSGSGGVATLGGEGVPAGNSTPPLPSEVYFGSCLHRNHPPRFLTTDPYRLMGEMKWDREDGSDEGFESESISDLIPVYFPWTMAGETSEAAHAKVAEDMKGLGFTLDDDPFFGFMLVFVLLIVRSL